MLQLQVLRQNPGWVKQRLAIRNFNEAGIVDAILELDDKRKKLQIEFDNTQAKVNSSSKEIGQLMAKGERENAEYLKQNVASLKTSLRPIADQLSETEKQLQNELVKLPNLPSEKVPAGRTPEDNVVVREGGVKPKLPEDALPHWELAKKYDLINFELSIKTEEQNYRGH
jgi:seryl-tRNA synthetase